MNETLHAPTLVANTDPEQVIGLALELVINNRYKPADSFYVTKDQLDYEGDHNYCGTCIMAGVRKAERAYKNKRSEIILKHKEILDKGFYMRGRKKVKVLKFTVLRSLANRLEHYQEDAKFSYSPYDPNFNGYLEAPESCEKCGRYFDTSFTPDEFEAEFLLTLANDSTRLSEREKWELAGAFEGFENIREDSVKEMMVKVAEKVIQRFGYKSKKVALQ